MIRFRWWLRSRWPWPWVKRIDAERRQHEAVRQTEARFRRELDEERAKLQKLIPNVMKILSRRFGDNGIYTLNITLDSHVFGHPYDQREREYFAEYVAREVEHQVARLIVSRPIDPETSRLVRF